ncbi:MAG TPA: hypothetical protein VFI31_06420 [Pirellulales bacterium]|nr:hypothetical protein [Pirellulales bacterium]
MRRRVQFGFLHLVCVLLAVGCSAKPIAKTNQSSDPAEGPVVRVYLLDGEYYEKRAVETGEEGPFAAPDNSFRTWPILDSRRITAQEIASSIREAISDPANFGGGGADCFNPGLGISIDEGDKQVDAVVCIECEWVYRYEPGKEVEKETLSAAGKEKFARLYAEVFPEESQQQRGK